MKSNLTTWASRTMHELDMMRASFRPNLTGISLSNNSSTSSFASVSSASTQATSIADENEYDYIEGILVQKSSAVTQHNFTNAQKEFRHDLHNLLNEALKDHEYLSRLRLVAKDPSSFRPAILIVTKSARTKKAFARYLTRGPPIMRRMVANELDIHIVLDGFGLAGDSSDTLHSVPALDSQVSFHPASNMESTNGHITITDNASGKTTTFAAGTRLFVDEEPVFVSVYHPLAMFDSSKQHWQRALSHTLEMDGSKDYTGAVSIYYDEIHDPLLTRTPRHSDMETKSAPDRGRSETLCIKDFSNPSTLNLGQYTQEREALASLRQIHGMVAACRRSTGSDGVRRVSEAPRAAVKDLSGIQMLSHSEDLDWTLWRVRPEQHAMMTQPIRVNGEVIETFVSKDDQTSKDVILNLPGEDIAGKSQLDTIMYQIGPKQLELTVVSVDKASQKGCSGALVTHKNQAFGMVIAIANRICEAYVLPFDKIVSDIESVMGQSVRLPLPAAGSDEAPQSTDASGASEIRPIEGVNSIIGESSHDCDSWSEKLPVAVNDATPYNQTNPVFCVEIDAPQSEREYDNRSESVVNDQLSTVDGKSSRRKLDLSSGIVDIHQKSLPADEDSSWTSSIDKAPLRIIGCPGAGKTHLAREYIRKHSSNFVFWIQSEAQQLNSLTKNALDEWNVVGDLNGDSNIWRFANTKEITDQLLPFGEIESIPRFPLDRREANTTTFTSLLGAMSTRQPWRRYKNTRSLERPAEMASSENSYSSDSGSRSKTWAERKERRSDSKKLHGCTFESCGYKSFATRNDLDRHTKTVHERHEGSLRCFYPGCKRKEKTWARRDNFKAHVKRIHGITEFLQHKTSLQDGLLHIYHSPLVREPVQNDQKVSQTSSNKDDGDAWQSADKTGKQCPNPEASVQLESEAPDPTRGHFSDRVRRPSRPHTGRLLYERMKSLTPCARRQSTKPEEKIMGRRA